MAGRVSNAVRILCACPFALRLSGVLMCVIGPSRLGKSTCREGRGFSTRLRKW